MPKYSQSQLDEQYKKLPEELKDALSGTDISNKVLNIGKKFSFTVEKTGFIAEEIAYVILGLSHPRDLPKNLEERLNIEEEEAEKIADDISQQIFSPIREAFKKAYQIEVPAAGTSKPEFRPSFSAIAAEMKREASTTEKPMASVPPISPTVTPKPSIIIEPKVPMSQTKPNPTSTFEVKRPALNVPTPTKPPPPIRVQAPRSTILEPAAPSLLPKLPAVPEKPKTFTAPETKVTSIPMSPKVPTPNILSPSRIPPIDLRPPETASGPGARVSVSTQKPIEKKEGPAVPQPISVPQVDSRERKFDPYREPIE